MTDMHDSLRTFIASELLMDPERTLADDEDLLLTGLVDSLGVMRLIYFLEESTGRKIPFTDITIENFNNIGAICAYLERD